MDRLLQRFNSHGVLLCMVCHEPIADKQLFIEVHQRHNDDSDALLAVHVGCLGGELT